VKEIMIFISVGNILYFISSGLENKMLIGRKMRAESIFELDIFRCTFVKSKTKLQRLMAIGTKFRTLSGSETFNNFFSGNIVFKSKRQRKITNTFIKNFNYIYD
jgi:hypothetical protein